MVVSSLNETCPDNGKIGVVVVPIWMKARQKLVYYSACRLHINTDDSWSILLNTLYVSDFDLLTISFRIGASKAVGLKLFRCVDLSILKS